MPSMGTTTEDVGPGRVVDVRPMHRVAATQQQQQKQPSHLPPPPVMSLTVAATRIQSWMRSCWAVRDAMRFRVLLLLLLHHAQQLPRRCRVWANTNQHHNGDDDVGVPHEHKTRMMRSAHEVEEHLRVCLLDTLEVVMCYERTLHAENATRAMLVEELAASSPAWRNATTQARTQLKQHHPQLQHMYKLPLEELRLVVAEVELNADDRAQQQHQHDEDDVTPLVVMQRALVAMLGAVHSATLLQRVISTSDVCLEELRMNDDAPPIFRALRCLAEATLEGRSALFMPPPSTTTTPTTTTTTSAPSSTNNISKYAESQLPFVEDIPPLPATMDDDDDDDGVDDADAAHLDRRRDPHDGVCSITEEAFQLDEVRPRPLIHHPHHPSHELRDGMPHNEDDEELEMMSESSSSDVDGWEYAPTEEERNARYFARQAKKHAAIRKKMRDMLEMSNTTTTTSTSPSAPSAPAGVAEQTTTSTRAPTSACDDDDELQKLMTGQRSTVDVVRVPELGRFRATTTTTTSVRAASTATRTDTTSAMFCGVCELPGWTTKTDCKDEEDEKLLPCVVCGLPIHVGCGRTYGDGPQLVCSKPCATAVASAR